jgi:phosphatidylserine decarboxylase
VYIDQDLKTNRWRGLKVGTMREKEFDELALKSDAFLNKGELVGQFNMGSTIVLVFEAPSSFRYVENQCNVLSVQLFILIQLYADLICHRIKL